MIASSVLDCLDWAPHYYLHHTLELMYLDKKQHCKQQYCAHWWSSFSILKSQSLLTRNHLAFPFNWTLPPVPRITRSLTLAFNFYCTQLRLHTTPIHSPPLSFCCMKPWNQNSQHIAWSSTFIDSWVSFSKGEKAEVITGAKQHCISEPRLIHSNS